MNDSLSRKTFRSGSPYNIGCATIFLRHRSSAMRRDSTNSSWNRPRNAHLGWYLTKSVEGTVHCKYLVHVSLGQAGQLLLGSLLSIEYRATESHDTFWRLPSHLNGRLTNWSTMDTDSWVSYSRNTHGVSLVSLWYVLPYLCPDFINRVSINCISHFLRLLNANFKVGTGSALWYAVGLLKLRSLEWEI